MKAPDQENLPRSGARAPGGAGVPPAANPLAPEPEPFARFMARALYHPQKGYYTARIRGMGRTGDFTTPAAASPLIGKAVAHWLRETWKRFPKITHVIEVGGGDGSLMRDAQKTFGWLGRVGKHFHMVEISPALEKMQRAKLGKAAAAWHPSMATALDACGGSALIFHHEMVDAFPVTILRKEKNGWSKLCVLNSKEVWQPWQGASTPKESSVFSPEANALLPPGQRVEIAFTYRDWLRQWTPHWQSGAMLTMDYGSNLLNLYRRRPQGTLRAYFHHQRLTGAEVCQNAGWQDITADVNFTDLAQWGAALGIRPNWQLSLADFLARHTAAKNRAKHLEQYLMEKDGAGTAFQVLEQQVA